MDFEDLLDRRCDWLDGSGESSLVAVCSRVRIARNFADTPFPNRAGDRQLSAVSERVVAAARKCSLLEEAVIKDIDDIKPLDLEFLVERHLVSREFIKKHARSAIIIGGGGVINIMVNEEDHLRLQVMKPGLDVAEAWRTADRLESELGGEIDFSFSSEWGYLSACPTNLGTGLRASVMVHLPMLVISRRIVRVLTRVAKSGIAPRGAYGEGSEPSGNLFQLSNQFTLGKTEESIISEIERAALGVIAEEESARESVIRKNKRSLEDKLFRAWGILKNARIIGSVEALELLSQLKLGAGEGIIDIDAGVIDELILNVRPAHLQKLFGEELPRSVRDVKRADYIRTKLS